MEGLDYFLIMPDAPTFSPAVEITPQMIEAGVKLSIEWQQSEDYRVETLVFRLLSLVAQPSDQKSTTVQ